MRAKYWRLHAVRWPVHERDFLAKYSNATRTTAPTRHRGGRRGASSGPLKIVDHLRFALGTNDIASVSCPVTMVDACFFLTFFHAKVTSKQPQPRTYM